MSRAKAKRQTISDIADEASPFVRGGGPGLRGEKHPMVKLDDAQVAALRAEYAADPVRGKQAALARKYHISQTHVLRLLAGESRKEVGVSKKSTKI
jgi:hypothetical protein